MRCFRVASILVILSILSGCADFNSARRMPAEINAYAISPIMGKRIFIAPTPSQENVNQIEFFEASSKVAKSLSVNGAIQVKNKDSADQIIMFAVAFGGNETQSIIKTSNEYGEVYGNAGAKYIGITSQNSSTDKIYTGSNFSLAITGFNAKSAAQEWRTDVAVLAQSSDIRLVTPYLLAAGCEYFGKSTGKRISSQVFYNSSIVRFINGELDTLPIESERDLIEKPSVRAKRLRGR